MKKIAIQGYKASFHDQAARQFFGKDIEIVPCDTFKAVFEAVHNNTAESAVVAIENSLFGSINEVYDLLLAHKLQIVGEVYLRIEHCLVGLPGATLSDISEIHSHPVAMAQCEDYLDEHLPQAERFEHHDTAASVDDVKKWGDKHKAAIASEAAAKLHEMSIIQKNIETHHENYTRFVVLDIKPNKSDTADKTSMILETADKPGALYSALGVFAKQDINLTKLQSRPIVGRAWKYMFYVDVEAGAHSNALRKAISELNRQSCETIILGSYTSAR